MTMTKAGDRVGDQVRRKLTDMVDAAALLEAHRRRATAIDSIDYERAFDEVAGRPRGHRMIGIVADLGAAIGTGLIGYAINIYTNRTTNMLAGHVAFFSGIALAAGGIVLKYVVPGR